MADMAKRLTKEKFTLHEYTETVTNTHRLIVAAANNDFLADAMAPVQGLSRRFWYAHVVDDAKEIATGARLHTAMLTAILASDEDGAETASQNLIDYLVDFTLASIRA